MARGDCAMRNSLHELAVIPMHHFRRRIVKSYEMMRYSDKNRQPNKKAGILT